MQMENENDNTPECPTKEFSSEKELSSSESQGNNLEKVQLVPNLVPLEVKSASINEQECENTTETQVAIPERTFNIESNSVPTEFDSFVDQQKSENITKEDITEEDISESPFALQSLVDVPDFEFMGLDGAYETPF